MKFRWTFGRIIAAVAVVCIVGLGILQSGEDRQKERTRQRIALSDHNMDVEMGDLKERIHGVLRSHCRGILCPSKTSDGGNWYKGSLVHRDILDVFIPYISNGRKKLEVWIYMRDKSATLAQAEPVIAEAAGLVLKTVDVPQEDLERCQSELGVFLSGAYGKMKCKKNPVTHFFASNGDPLDGSLLMVEVELP